MIQHPNLEGLLPEKEWKMILRLMPIPCVDVILEKSSRILMGFRTISPYKNVWALPGGRIRKHEHPEDTVKRVLKEIGVSASIKEFIGVFPVRFPRHSEKRYDITLCYRSNWKKGDPRSTLELTRFQWVSMRQLPKRTGGNYRRMMQAAFFKESK